jgi:DNA invertase Pin-like site-specific DNA recombinase
VFVDVISVSAVLYRINFANCYQNGPPKDTKEPRKEEKVKKAITIEKKKEIVQKYESGVRVTDLANMYSVSKSTLFLL